MQQSQIKRFSFNDAKFLIDRKRWNALEDVLVNKDSMRIADKTLAIILLELSKHYSDSGDFAKGLQYYIDTKALKFQSPSNLETVAYLFSSFINEHGDDFDYQGYTELQEVYEREMEFFADYKAKNSSSYKQLQSTFNTISCRRHLAGLRSGDLNENDTYPVYYGKNKINIKLTFTGEYTMAELGEKFWKLLGPSIRKFIAEREAK